MSKKIAIVTGATGGVGREFTKELLKEEIDEVWAIARKEEKLNNLKNEFGEKIIPLSIDIGKTSDLLRIEELLNLEKPQILFLVNNASLAKMGSYEEFSIEEIESTINVNCKAPVILSKLCLPFMERGSCILNISSASAFQPTPYINLYAATKAFERSYSRALNVELEKRGVTVTAVCPSWVDTELLTKSINGHKVEFPGIVTANEVATAAIRHGKKGKDMSICSFYVKCQHLNVKLLPHKLVMKLWMNGIRKYLNT